ncbi:MAG: hypothetical protein WC595_06275 [Candidatus Nanoarchaeia archaeon]
MQTLKELLRITPLKIVGLLFFTFLIEFLALGLAEHTGGVRQVAHGLPFIFYTQQCALLVDQCQHENFSITALLIDFFIIYSLISLAFSWKPPRETSAYKNSLFKKMTYAIIKLSIIFILFIALVLFTLGLSILSFGFSLPNPVTFFI